MNKPARILMVDDDTDYANGIRLVLESRGYSFHHARDNAEGLSKLKEVAPDLIILDVIMNTKAEGFLFAKKIRSAAEYAPFSKTPILILTGMRGQKGYTFPSPPDQAVFTPRDEFLEKPVQPDDLLKTVAELLESR